MTVILMVGTRTTTWKDTERMKAREQTASETKQGSRVISFSACRCKILVLSLGGEKCHQGGEGKIPDYIPQEQLSVGRQGIGRNFCPWMSRHKPLLIPV